MTIEDDLPSDDDVDIKYAEDLSSGVCEDIAKSLPTILTQALPKSTIEQVSVRQYGGGFTHGSVRVVAGTGFLVTCKCAHGTEFIRIHKPTPITWRGQKIVRTYQESG